MRFPLRPVERRQINSSSKAPLTDSFRLLGLFTLLCFGTFDKQQNALDEPAPRRTRRRSRAPTA